MTVQRGLSGPSDETSHEPLLPSYGVEGVHGHGARIVCLERRTVGRSRESEAKSWQEGSGLVIKGADRVLRGDPSRIRGVGPLSPRQATP